MPDAKNIIHLVPRNLRNREKQLNWKIKGVGLLDCNYHQSFSVNTTGVRRPLVPKLLKHLVDSR